MNQETLASLISTLITPEEKAELLSKCGNQAARNILENDSSTLTTIFGLALLKDDEDQRRKAKAFFRTIEVLIALRTYQYGGCHFAELVTATYELGALKTMLEAALFYGVDSDVFAYNRDRNTVVFNPAKMDDVRKAALNRIEATAARKEERQPLNFFAPGYVAVEKPREGLSQVLFEEIKRETPEIFPGFCTYALSPEDWSKS